MDNNVFSGSVDIHKGIHVDSTKEPCRITNFGKKLEDSLEKWKQEGARAVWFNVSVSDVEWIPVLFENGFRIHRGLNDRVHLVKWLPQDEKDQIPSFAHTMVGAGGLVVNKSGQILVVCDRYRPVPYWKIPGGFMEPGEDIVAAAQREVLEETNIQTEFVSIFSFSHTLEYTFGCRDFYFIVELRALNEDIKKDDSEIIAAQWMDIEEYLNHPMVLEKSRMMIKKYLLCKEKNIFLDRETTFNSVINKEVTLYFPSTH